jgi:hypothetical protein
MRVMVSGPTLLESQSASGHSNAGIDMGLHRLLSRNDAPRTLALRREEGDDGRRQWRTGEFGQHEPLGWVVSCRPREFDQVCEEFLMIDLSICVE